MNNSGMSQSPAIDQDVLNRIVQEVFLRLNPAGVRAAGEIQSVKRPQVEGGLNINPKRIPVGVSVRHVHVSRQDLDKLFGPGHELTHLRELYQPGTHAEKETVSLIGPKMRMLERVRILGPMRDRTQVEIAKTDAIFLGVDAPLRLSGDLAGSSPITIVGPKGVVELDEGCIRAMRHIHMHPREAEYFGLNNGDNVKLRVGGPSAVTFENVVIRVSDKVRLEVHLDTDEGNVADIGCGQEVEIIKD